MISLRGALATTLHRYGGALAFTDFRTMWTANLAAQSAAWALIVSRGWLVYDMTQSSMAVGAVTFAAMFPQVFMPPIAGVLADRMDRRTLLATTYAANLVNNLVLALLVATGLVEQWHLIGLAVLNGMARATQLSTSQALAANLVPQQQLLNALSLSAATTHAARLVGPALATPFNQFLGPAAAFLLCTSLYGVGWLQIARIRTSARGGARRDESFLSSFTDGLRYVRSQPFIRMVLVLVGFHCALTMAFESLLPSFSAHSLAMGTSGFGVLMTAVGAGSFVGSLVVGGIRGDHTRGKLYLALGLASGIGQVALSLTGDLLVAIAAAAVMGGSQSAFMTMGQAITQSLAANEYRGRVASLNAMSFGGLMSVMNLVNGVAASAYSAALILFVNGLLFALIMAASLALATPRQAYLVGVPATAGTGH